MVFLFYMYATYYCINETSIDCVIEVLDVQKKKKKKKKKNEKKKNLCGFLNYKGRVTLFYCDVPTLKSNLESKQILKQTLQIDTLMFLVWSPWFLLLIEKVLLY